MNKDAENIKVINETLSGVSDMILTIPSGNLRNLLCDVQIILTKLINDINFVKQTF